MITTAGSKSTPNSPVGGGGGGIPPASPRSYASSYASGMSNVGERSASPLQHRPSKKNHPPPAGHGAAPQTSSQAPPPSMSAGATVQHLPHRHELYRPPPTSMALSAALLLLDAPVVAAASSTAGSVVASSSSPPPPPSPPNSAIASSHNSPPSPSRKPPPSAPAGGGQSKKPLSPWASGRDHASYLSTTATPPRQPQSMYRTGGGGGGGVSGPSTASSAPVPAIATAEEDGVAEYVYLLPRPYVQNWINWAYEQLVPPDEVGRLKMALRMAAELHGLTCGGRSCQGDGDGNNGGGGMGVPFPPITSPPAPKRHRPPSALLPPTQQSGGRSRLSSDNRGGGLLSESKGPSERSPPAPPCPKPGPIDAASLSILGHPLLLRPHVVVGRGCTDEEPDALDDLDRANGRLFQPRRAGSAMRGGGGGGGGGGHSRAPSPPVRPSGGGGSVAGGMERPRAMSVERPKALLRRTRSLSLDRGGRQEQSSPHRQRQQQQNGSPGGGGQQAMESSLGISGSGSGEDGLVGKVGSCAVPERFYELLRSVHGVLCDDGVSVSFQPPDTKRLGGGGGQRNSSSGSNPSSASSGSGLAGGRGGGGGGVLHHHVIAARDRASIHVHRSDLKHPISSLSDIRPRKRGESPPGRVPVGKAATGGAGVPVGSVPVPTSPRPPPPMPRPVEFRRRVLSVTTLSPPPPAGAVAPSYASSASASQRKPQPPSRRTVSKTVEVYPVKFFYSIIEGGGVGSRSASPTQSTVVSAVSSTASRESRGSRTSGVTGTSVTSTSQGYGTPDTMALLRGAATKLKKEKGSGGGGSGSSGGGGGKSSSSGPRGTTATTATTNGVSSASKPPRQSQRSYRNQRLTPPPPEREQHEPTPTPVFPQRGFVLVSRSATASEALHAVLKAAAPEKSSVCVRMWSKIGTTTMRQCQTRRSTMKGDGYDLIDLEFLDGKAPQQRVPKVKKEESTVAKNGGTAVVVGSGKELKQQQPRQEQPQQMPHQKTPPLTVVKPPNVSVAEWVRRHVSAGSNLKSIDILVEIRHSPSAKWARDGLDLEHRIQVGDFVDAQDSTGKWYEAIVRKVTDETVKVHYCGWNSRWDSTIRRRRGSGEIKSVSKKAGPPAPLWSQTSRWREDVKVGDEVEVREAASMVQRPKWFRAVVRLVGREDDIVRETIGGAEVELYDDGGGEASSSSYGSGSYRSNAGDNKENGRRRRKKPLLLLNRTRQVLVEVPQERFNSSSTLPLPTSPSFDVDSMPSHATTPTAQPPFLRWVNLYGEEICEAGTHLKLDPNSSGGGGVPPATVNYAHDPSRPPVEVLKSFNNVHGAGFVRESLRGIPPAPGSVGLHNLGNSCFLNSILQCLNHTEPLTQYFLKGDYHKDLNRDNPLGSGGRVALSYAALLNDMWGGEYSTLAPRMLKQTVAHFAPQFNNVYQHDSQEFCSFLMDGLHEDLNRVKKKPYVEELEGVGMPDEKVAVESWRKHLLRHDSIVVDHCQGMHRSHLTCPVCAKESVKFDVFSTISLPLVPLKDRQSIPLDDCLEKFTAGEQLDEQNAWYCPKCKKHVCALKMIALWSTPDILILHLKRFTFNTCNRRGGLVRSKMDHQVDFPVDGLDMSPYILGPIDKDAPPIYNLFGVSEHSGSTANSGHYTATVRNSRDGKWYRCNDSHVGSTSGEAAITGGAYLLFYQRSKGKSRWAGLERIMNERHINPHGGLDTDQDGFVEVKSKKKNRKSGGGRK